jgi:chemotaxis protein MotB
MAAHGRRRRGHDAGHENEERWLLTYADMITLLMALFMVLFSISSVNVSKYVVLQQSLKAAFSGSILSGGKAILQAGSTSTANRTPAQNDVPSIVPLTPTISKSSQSSSTSSLQATTAQIQQALQNVTAAEQEQSDFQRLKQELDAYARAHGFADQVRTDIERRGLVVNVLTDKLLFASGQATLKPAGLPLLNEIAALLNIDQTHPIVVEGHTDNVPISTAQFPSNWELSTARATTVVRYLIGRSVNRYRLAAAGYADLHPVGTNATVTGRALNRRVAIVFQRLNPAPAS